MKRVFLLAAVTVLGFGTALQAQPTANQPKPSFNKDVKPFLKKYCNSCHGGKTPADGVNLEKIKTEADAKKELRSLRKSVRELENKKMPPKEEKAQPKEAETAKFITYVKSLQ